MYGFELLEAINLLNLNWTSALFIFISLYPREKECATQAASDIEFTYKTQLKMSLLLCGSSFDFVVCLCLSDSLVSFKWPNDQKKEKGLFGVIRLLYCPVYLCCSVLFSCAAL